MMEGVSPYIDRTKFEAFLRLLSARLEPGSVLAYDFKLQGVAPGFGHPESFRLPPERDAVAAYHHAAGVPAYSTWKQARASRAACCRAHPRSSRRTASHVLPADFALPRRSGATCARRWTRVIAQSLRPAQVGDRRRRLDRRHAAHPRRVRAAPRLDRDRHACAIAAARSVGPGVIEAFYAGLPDASTRDDYDYLCKLDLDLRLPPRYFEILIARMEADPRIGDLQRQGLRRGAAAARCRSATATTPRSA